MYTLAVSAGDVTTVCVCEPRQVCTSVMWRGFAMSVMSKMRIPRSRSWLTVSATPCVPQSVRPFSASPDTNSRFRYTETSLCDPGQTKALCNRGLLGLEMSQTWRPEKLPCMTYDLVNDRSELMNAKSPGLLLLMKSGDGGVVETRRMFQAARAASIHPARSPTRGSGLGAVVDMS